MSLAEIASPRSDINITRVNHIENIKRHKPEIIRESFNKYLYCFCYIYKYTLYFIVILYYYFLYKSASNIWLI